MRSIAVGFRLLILIGMLTAFAFGACGRLAALSATRRQSV